jgi:hypothetical protein
MKYQKEDLGVSPSCPVSSRPSLREAVSRAEQQIERYAFAEHEQDRVRELCFIIAEVYMMNPEHVIRISGEDLDAALVKEVFGELRNEHVRLVLDNFKSVTDIVRYKKAYFRSALYHSVFELESHYANLVNHDLAKGKRV